MESREGGLRWTSPGAAVEREQKHRQLVRFARAAPDLILSAIGLLGQQRRVTCARDASLGFGPSRHARLLALTLPSFSFLCPSLSLYHRFLLQISFLSRCLPLHCATFARIIELTPPSPRITLLAHPKPLLRITSHIAILSRFPASWVMLCVVLQMRFKISRSMHLLIGRFNRIG